MVTAARSVQVEKTWRLLEQIPDPEIPVISIVDLGMVREVRETSDSGLEVIITPTYSGCPALPTIEQDIQRTLDQAGFAAVRVQITLSPAWSTDWISEAGRKKLREYGIAPPSGAKVHDGVAVLNPYVLCPRCKSLDTEVVSEFGSTACKALYRCRQCLEPFDYFKPL